MICHVPLPKSSLWIVFYQSSPFFPPKPPKQSQLYYALYFISRKKPLTVSCLWNTLVLINISFAIPQLFAFIRKKNKVSNYLIFFFLKNSNFGRNWNCREMTVFFTKYLQKFFKMKNSFKGKIGKKVLSINCHFTSVWGGPRCF